MIDANNFNGFLGFILFASIPVAILLSIIIRRLYRRAITRAMIAASDVPESAFDIPDPDYPNGSALEFDIQPLARKHPVRWALAGRYLAAGIAFAIVMTVALFLIEGMEFLPVRTGVVIAAFAFPAIIMGGYVAGLRWYYILALFVFWNWLLYTIAPQSTDIIGMLVAPSLLLSLLAGNPALRTTAIPLFLVAISLVTPLVFVLDVFYLIAISGTLEALWFLPPGLTFWGAGLLSLGIMLALGIGFALIAVRLIARLTADSSEFMMQHDLLYLIQVFWMVGLGWGINGPVVLCYFLAFATYRAALWGLRPRSTATDINLHLRVFGQAKSQKTLARGLLLDWRQKGPVLLIGAADLATETLDAPELAAFLRRRLGDVFINSPDDLAKAGSAGEARLGDGLFPMQDYYCRDNSWRPTVLTLMSRAARILVDMRGFNPTNKGIQFEINALAERVPANRIVLLAEAKNLTDVQTLVAEIWAKTGQSQGADRMTLLVDGKVVETDQSAAS